jgi:hypothetical protein
LGEADEGEVEERRAYQDDGNRITKGEKDHDSNEEQTKFH